MKKLFKGIIKTYTYVTSVYFTIVFTSAVISVTKKNRRHKEMLDYVKENKHKINIFNQ